MHVGGNGLGDIWADLATNLPGILAGGAAIVQATRPPPSPPAGVTSSYGVPSGQGYQPGVSPGAKPPPFYEPARSFLSDPTTLAMIAFAGVAVLLVVMKR